jgi:hypothetical protein
VFDAELLMGGYFLWLAEMGSSFLLYVWPVTLGLTVWTALCWWSTIRRRRHTVGRDLPWSICPLAGTLLILGLGCVLAHEGPAAANWPWAVFLVQLVGSIVLLSRGRETLHLFVAMFTLELWISYWMAGVSGMSISDKWL